MYQTFNIKIWYISYNVLPIRDKRCLKFCRFGCAWEGNDVTDVLHAGDEQYQTLETQSETGMRT